MSRLATAILCVLMPSLACIRAVAAPCDTQGDCLVVHPNPGCSDTDCCITVCGVDPLCCSDGWDADCVSLANTLCIGLCGAEASGDCSIPHETPGCNRRDCCEAVCMVDPFCCDVRWDFFCVVISSSQCSPQEPGTCGDPKAGSCVEPHAEPACADLACCELVCSVDPSCCTQSWDLFCVTVANQYCVESCKPECPEGAVYEDEDCGQDVNNPCYLTPSPFPAVQALGCGTWACGQISSTAGGFRDIDLWFVSVVDEDGDGLVPARVEFASSFDGFAALVPVPCGPLASAIVKVETDFCLELPSETACLTPGQYLLVVAAGAFPNPGNPELPCGQFGSTRYRVRLTCLSNGCGPACGPGAGSCFEPRKLPGCEEPSCCEAVCAVIPACCDVQWDSDCVLEAQSACAEPPPNDDCTGATPVQGEVIEVINVGATASEPPFPIHCGGTNAGADLWFSIVAPRTASCTVTTCGGGTIDTTIAAYQTCDGVSLTCNDDSSQCVPETSSRVTFDVTCGDSVLLRIGSIGGLPGTATLRVTYGQGPGCACESDLDKDGNVGGSDLTMLLSSWSGPGADLDGDGTTSGSDLTIMLSSWGPCP